MSSHAKRNEKHSSSYFSIVQLNVSETVTVNQLFVNPNHPTMKCVSVPWGTSTWTVPHCSLPKFHLLHLDSTYCSPKHIERIVVRVCGGYPLNHVNVPDYFAAGKLNWLPGSIGRPTTHEEREKHMDSNEQEIVYIRFPLFANSPSLYSTKASFSFCSPTLDRIWMAWRWKALLGYFNCWLTVAGCGSVQSVPSRSHPVHSSINSSGGRISSVGG